MRLSELVTVVKGKKPQIVRGVPEQGDVRLLQIEDLREGAVHRYAPRVAGHVMAEPTDALLAWDGANAGTSGFGLQGLVGSTIAVLRPRDPVSLHTAYLGHFLRSRQEFLRATCKGATVPHIDGRRLGQLELALPPIEKQREVADNLDRLDALLALRRRQLELLSSLRPALFTEALAQESDAPVQPITELCTLVVDCVNRTAPTVDGPTAFKMIRTTNVRNGVVDTTNVRYVEEDTYRLWNRRAVPGHGDVLLTREAPVGEAGILSGDDQVFLGQRLMLYRPNPSLLTSEFLCAAFASDFLKAQFRKMSSGSTVKHLPLPACRSFGIPVLSMRVQLELTAAFKSITRLEQLSSRGEASLMSLRDSLRFASFGGG